MSWNGISLYPLLVSMSFLYGFSWLMSLLPLYFCVNSTFQFCIFGSLSILS